MILELRRIESGDWGSRISFGLVDLRPFGPLK